MKKITALDWISNKIESVDLHENRASLGLNKHVQKKFNDVDAVDNVSEFVDLGLPSGTLWCKHNYGANTEEEYGDYLTYNEARDLDIVVSSKEDFEELIANCDHKWTSVNGTNGMMFTSKTNGKTVFFPTGGLYDDHIKLVTQDTIRGYYWSSTAYASKKYAYYMYIDSFSSVHIEHFSRSFGFSVRAVQKPIAESELGLNKRVQKDYSSDQAKHMDDFNSAISDDLLTVEEFYNVLRDTIPDFDNNDTFLSVRPNGGHIVINKYLDCDDMRHKLYFAFWSFDRDFIKTENAFRISLSIESSVGFVRNVGWNLDRKSWKNFDKAFCDFEESPENGRFFFKTTKRALAQVIEFAKKFAEYGVNIWEESFDFGEQDDTGVFLNMNSVGLRKVLKPSVEKWILNNN